MITSAMIIVWPNLDNNSEFSVRGEVITQTVDDGSVPVGEETPDLDAFVFQINYSLVW